MRGGCSDVVGRHPAICENGQEVIERIVRDAVRGPEAGRRIEAERGSRHQSTSSMQSS